jgi:hypothetical protein
VKLLRQLHETAAEVGNESAEANAIRDEMDPVWYQLTEAEMHWTRHLSVLMYQERASV